MRHVYLTAMLLLSVATSAPAQTSPQVNLRPGWKAGHTSRYHFTTTRVQNMTMSAGGETRSAGTSLTSEGELVWQVDRANADGSYACGMTLSWMTAELTDPEGKVQRNDSRRASGDVPPIQDLLKAMTGVKLTVTVAPDGRITKVDNVDAMRRRAQNPDMVPEELDFIESATDLATLVGAPVQLSPGGSWNADFKWTHDLGLLHQNMTYQLAGVEEIEGIPVAVVTGTARNRLEVDRSQLPADGPPIDVRLTASEHSSQIMFDLLRHEAVGRNTFDSRTIEMVVRLPTPPGPVTRRMQETISSQTLRIAEGQ